MKIIVVVLILISVFSSATVQGNEFDPNSESDAIASSPIIVSKSLILTKINADGSYTTSEKNFFEIQNEKGRTTGGIREVYFDPAKEKVKVTSAYTLNGKTKSKVDLNKLVVQSVSAGTEGIRSLKKIVIPYDKVKVGSKVVYQIKRTVKKVLVPKASFHSFQYGVDYPEKNSVVKIVSDLPIKYAVFDKNKRVSISQRKDEGKFILVVKTIGTVFPGSSIRKKGMIESGDFPVVMVSTASDWNQISNSLAPKYEKIISAPLPPKLKSIALKAKNFKTDQEKIGYVLKKVSKLIAYSGRWTSMKAMFFPKGHSTVVKEAKGDCKDFATTIAGVMRALGFDSNVAIVRSDHPTNRLYRDDSLQNLPPSMDYFNHAITYVKSSDGNEHWIDGTRATNITNGIWPSLAEQPALILDGSNKSIVKLPKVAVDKNEFHLVRKAKHVTNEKAEWSGRIRLSGSSVAELQEQLKTYGNQKMSILFAAGILGDLATSETKPSLDTGTFSTINREFSLRFGVLGKNPFSGNHAGVGTIQIPANLSAVQYLTANKASGVHLGSPGKETIETHIEGTNVTDEIDGSCFVVSPWLDYNKKIENLPNSVVVKEIYERKKSKITISEAQSENYEEFVSAFKSCFNNKLSAHSIGSKPKGETDLTELQKLPIKSSSFDKMVEIFEGNLVTDDQYSYITKKGFRIFEKKLDSDQHHSLAKTLYARAITRMGTYSSNYYNDYFYDYSLKMLDEVIANDPNLALAYDKRYRIYKARMKYDKALENAMAAHKLDKTNVRYIRQIAGVYAHLKNKKLAYEWLEAVRLRATNPQLKVDYYKSARDVYELFGETDRSLVAYKEIAKLTPSSAWAAGNYADALADSGQLQQALVEVKRALSLMNYPAARSTLGKIQYKMAKKRKSEIGETKAFQDSEYERLLIDAQKNNQRNYSIYESLSELYLSRAETNLDSQLIDRSELYLEQGRKLQKYIGNAKKINQRLDNLKQKLLKQYALKNKKPPGRWPMKMTSAKVTKKPTIVGPMKTKPQPKSLKADELIEGVWWPKGTEVTYNNGSANSFKISKPTKIANVTWPKDTKFGALPIPGKEKQWFVMTPSKITIDDIEFPAMSTVMLSMSSVSKVVVRENVPSPYGDIPKMSSIIFKENKVDSISLRGPATINGKSSKSGETVKVRD